MGNAYCGRRGGKAGNRGVCARIAAGQSLEFQMHARGRKRTPVSARFQVVENSGLSSYHVLLWVMVHSWDLLTKPCESQLKPPSSSETFRPAPWGWGWVCPRISDGVSGRELGGSMPASSLWSSRWGEWMVEEGPVLTAGPPPFGICTPRGGFSAPGHGTHGVRGPLPMSLFCCLATSCHLFPPSLWGS